MNRLDERTFRQLLAKYPDFQLGRKSWLGGTSGACGGCAMTLAYHDAHPDVPLGGYSGFCHYELGDKIEAWADQTYGEFYVHDFVCTFDSDPDARSLDDTGLGYIDGCACLNVARDLGRLS